MRTIKKNVYYCDFCGKRGLSSFAMSVHETHCTANPHRECRLCKNDHSIASYARGLQERFEIILTHDDLPDGSYETIRWIGEPITLDEIVKYTDGCPNCTLAILRQTKLHYEIFGFEYDYKKELSKWHDDHRKSYCERMEDYY